MAQRQQVMWIDDLDQVSEAAEKVRFSLDGTDYEIDLSSGHAAGLREEMLLYVSRASRSRKQPQARRSQRGTARPDLPEIREWARMRGYDVKDAGAVPRRIVAEYDTLVTLNVIRPGTS